MDNWSYDPGRCRLPDCLIDRCGCAAHARRPAGNYAPSESGRRLSVALARSRGRGFRAACTPARIFYLINVWGYSPLTAGLAGTPAPFLAAAVAALAGWLVVKRGPRPLIVVGATIWAIGPLILIGRFSTSPHYVLNYLPQPWSSPSASASPFLWSAT